MHWGTKKFLYYMTPILLNCQAKTTPKQPKRWAGVELGRAGAGSAGWGWVGLRGAE